MTAPLDLGSCPHRGVARAVPAKSSGEAAGPPPSRGDETGTDLCVLGGSFLSADSHDSPDVSVDMHRARRRGRLRPSPLNRRGLALTALICPVAANIRGRVTSPPAGCPDGLTTPGDPPGLGTKCSLEPWTAVSRACSAISLAGGCTLEGLPVAAPQFLRRVAVVDRCRRRS